MIHRVLPEGATAVLLGDGAAACISAEVEQLGGERALVLATPRRTESARDASVRLGPRSAGVLGIAEEHVPRSVVDRGVAESKRRAADTLVAVGGGSTVGLAKAIALELGLPIVALPTTFSGSEMTPIWGITEGGSKRTGRDDRVRAACVLYDPRLSLTLPASVAVASAFNALAHAVEALYAAGADEKSLWLAEEAARLLVEGIPALASGSTEIAPREHALHGACLAGTCLARTSVGLHHRLCHVLGGAFGMPHALTHAVLLPHVARFNLEAAPEARRRLTRAFGGQEPVAELFALAARAGVPRGLAALGLPADVLPRAAEIAAANPYPNPRPASVHEVQALLEAAHRGC